MKKQKSNTGLIVVLVILIMLVLFWFCLFFLYKEGYLSLDKENKKDVTLNDKKDEKDNNEKVQVSMKDIYNDLKNSKRTIITPNGTYSLDNYISGEAFNLGNMHKAEKYAYIDLDKDGIDELIFELSNTNEYAVLHYEDNNVYGYNYISLRGFRDLKIDGTYSASDSAYTTYIYKMSFNKNEYINNFIMNYDKQNNKCIINDESKPMDDCDNYINEQDKKENVTFYDFNG